MVNDQLLQSWKRTEEYLLDARSHLSETAEGVCAEEVREFSEYLRHNELELALDALAFNKSAGEPLRVLELMALAAASMGLIERQVLHDQQLSKARGWKYQTSLPSA